MNDKDGVVTLVLDKALFEHAVVNFHPLLNNATTAISRDDMTVFATATGHDPVILDFSALEDAR